MKKSLLVIYSDLLENLPLEVQILRYVRYSHPNLRGGGKAAEAIDRFALEVNSLGDEIFLPNIKAW